ncbi:sulfite exporter TauE/SafE family protein [Lactobacillus sp. LC28-10]|uniref:Probable membrane transporter protein n=1 Tax=Secundilactobacillus angelensis TaxID=2722706 RepID=A0ABX1KXJ2_9LACO|nr:sulfite exporter TauE/SafE family protein [Secundilactobacillus angelensis]MCH5462171.1 sulfite exporter TauE/SafE family protein [Secundilactobacillus angelensis]NLR18349.1 sulfite exporter TauE/SafE family protein [Secundilactobacillus angelensis]
MTWILVFFPALLAGLIQGLTGFGAVIIMMIFFPSILPMAQAAGIGGVIMLLSEISLVIHYHSEFKPKRVLSAFVVYAAVATWSVHLGLVLDTHLLRLMLGVLLIALSLYFLFSKSAGDRRYPLYVALLFMIISGFFNGLFGIGGPLMALYFLSLSKSMPEYIANIQGFFLIDGFYITTVRVATGILNAHVVPYILLGIVGATVGTIIASRLSTRWDLATVKPWIYRFIGLAGFYYLLF